MHPIRLAPMKIREILQHVGPETTTADMVALVDHPEADEAHVLAALRHRSLSSAAIEAVARHERWGARYAVKAAVVNHPKTPKTLALRVLSLLFWKELLRVSANYRLSMPIRVAAERRLVSQLPKLELGEKISIARSAPPRVISQLLEEASPRVIEALLRNPRLREIEILGLAENRNVSPETLRVLAQSPRWAVRLPVKLALVKNPRTPVHAALRLLGSFHKRDIARLLASGELPRIVALRAGQMAAPQST